MRIPPRIAIVVVLSLVAASAVANDETPSVQTTPPVVVKTEPQAGTTDADSGNTSEIRVTFSKPMQDGNWSFVQVSKDHYPKTTGKPRFEDDGRTCVLPVALEPGHVYVIWINKAPYNSFSDREGRKAVPYLLVFETKP